jgi:Secretion system C-terminal sorting domain
VKIHFPFFQIIIIVFFFYSTLAAQLELSVYTDKEKYEYGENIELFCKVTNNSDTTFEFLAGNYQSCQAEFSFNDFNSWEHTECLTLSELLTFKPHASKIYSWRIEPQRFGLPNKDGTQTIIGTYYFDLKDTVYINAPKFIGGEVRVTFNGNNIDSINSISDQLNANVVFGDHFGEIKGEVWQIEGFDIDSLVQIYSNDSIFVSFEKSVSIGYENIVDENPLDYYPLHVGDKWYFTYSGQTYDTDPGPFSEQIIWETIGDTLMPNNYKYFITKRSNDANIVYERIDTANCKVYGYYRDDILANNEYLIADLKLPIDSEPSEKVYYYTYPILFSYQKDTLMYITSSALIKEKTRFYFASGGQYGNCHITKNVGISRYYYEFDFGYRTWTLDYAVVNGKTYGDSTAVGVKKENSETVPTQFSLSQNYPNPFNPTTTIKYTIPISNFIAGGTEQSPTPKIATGAYIPRDEYVQLKVYDMLGSEITTLVNQPQKPGHYEIAFDASRYSSGIYFYQLKTEDFIQVKKMIYLK